MTKYELILMNSAKVRRDSNLLSLYVKYYQEVFGRKPDCVGCTFNSDWRKFVAKVSGTTEKNSLTLTKKDMSTFKLKKIQNKILFYKKDKKTYRSYDNVMTEGFVKGFLTNGSKKEIEERKKLFAILPEGFRTKEEVKDVVTESAKSEPETTEKAEPKKKGRKKAVNNEPQQE